MNAFVESIDSWRDFYMLPGSASATLVGLIFVAVTLHIDVIAEAKKSSDIRMLAEEIFINFLMILSFAFIFLIPSDTPTGVGYPLLILGTIQIVHTAILWLRFLRSRGEHRVFASSMILSGLLIPNTICYLTLIVIGADVLQGGTHYLGWMVMVIVWLTISAVKNTWHLMMRVAELKRNRQD
jgi:multidrug transporter EmrE-like cation transporter